MKGANYKVVLDACVLANHGVCDLFLRLAERPRLYTPVWSARILEETNRTHKAKLAWPEELADHWFPAPFATSPHKLAPFMSGILSTFCHRCARADLLSWTRRRPPCMLSPR